MSNFLKKLVKDWRDAGDSPTLANHPRVKGAYYRCADELDAMLGATEALGKFIKGTGVGLPHGTIAWVMFDGKRYIREWHPMDPAPNGTPLGNWWALEEGFSAAGTPRFSEHEITHYSIIEVPPIPEARSKKAQQPEGGPVEFQAVVGKSTQTGNFVAFTILADLLSGEPKLIEVAAETEQEALHALQLRADAVLRTFFSNYKTVRI